MMISLRKIRRRRAQRFEGSVAAAPQRDARHAKLE